jgi:hypothetical protein
VPHPIRRVQRRLLPTQRDPSFRTAVKTGTWPTILNMAEALGLIVYVLRTGFGRLMPISEQRFSSFQSRANRSHLIARPKRRARLKGN